MKNLAFPAAACCIFIFSLPAPAQVGGYRLIAQSGEVGTTPGDFAKSISWKDLAAPSAPQQPQSLNSILSDLVEDFQLALRVEPDPNATSLQRDELANQKYDHIHNLAAVLPGKAVYATFKVLDVVPAPSTPKDPAPAAFLVYGLFDWKSSPIVTDDDRHKIAAINQKYDAADKEAQAHYDSVMDNNTRQVGQGDNSGRHSTFTVSQVPDSVADPANRNLANKKADDASKRKSEIAQIKANEVAQVPRHMIYVYTDDQTVANWHRDETHKVLGFIQKIASFHYTSGVLVQTSDGVAEPLQNTYVSMEFVVKGVKGEMPTAIQPIDPSSITFDPPK